jgi:hypothetical protein
MVAWKNDTKDKLKLHYKQFNTPSDQILKDRDLLEKFTSSFNAKFTPDEQFAPKEIADQLLKLRKSGELPRIRK